MARRAKKVESENRESGKAKSQIVMSQKRIEGTKENSQELVTNIRVGVTARESLRRLEESRQIEAWEGRELEERNATENTKQIIDQEWAKIEKCSGPFELFDLLEKQKLACAEALDIKNKLLAEYVTELKSKDDEYVRELKRQAEEIDKLLDRMEAQYKRYQVALVEEIEQIERAFVEERTDLIVGNSKENQKLFSNRRSNETYVATN